MTEGQLEKAYAEKHGVSIGEANKVIDNVKNLMRDHFLNGGEPITIWGLGRFELRKRSGTTKVLGEPIPYEDKKRVAFVCSAKLKKELNAI